MGVVEFERNRIRQQEIEVKALVALLKHSKKYRDVAEMRLFEFSFPEEVAEVINQQQLELI